jgi:hypothetical protein
LAASARQPEEIMKSVSLLVAALLGGCASAPDAKELAQVSVIDRVSGERLEVYRHQGRLYVAGRPGAKYSITVRNDTGARVLTVVSVDGVNVVSGETAAPDQTGYVLDRHEGVDIAGWRKSLNEVAAFVFTALPDSYAARTGRPDNVGVIGVAVFREKPTPPALLSAPVAAERARSGAADSTEKKAERLGTGHGERETSVVQYTNFERASSRPDQMVSIYYDSRPNLSARGIIPHSAIGHPNPFPGHFVPDPWG